ncbi:MAG: hypothetical protein WD468_08940 [Pirellulales bacterium]
MKILNRFAPRGLNLVRSKRSPRRRSYRRPLRVETLEDRRLLAIDNLTVVGAQQFSTLAANDGGTDPNVLEVINLTIQDGGSINANDDWPTSVPNSSAAPPIIIVASGNVLFAADATPGDTGIFAENRVQGGRGGDITMTVGGTFTMRNGAIISSSDSTSGGNPAGSGDITINVAGDIDVPTGAIIKAGLINAGNDTNNGPGGAIFIVSQDGDINIDGSILSQSGLSGTGANQAPGGGPITIKGQNVLTVSDTGVISSKGQDPGADLVHLEACEIFIYGLVESTGHGHAVPNNPPNHLNGTNRPDKDPNSTAGVEIWAGSTLVIDSLNHNGQVNADLTIGAMGRSWIDLFAVGAITIIGDTTGPFAVHATNGGNNPTGGTITVKSTEGTITASGLAIDASAGGSGFPDGGTIVVEAMQGINLNTAQLLATGDFNPTGGIGDGGNISVRSSTGAVSWQNGVGDVRPTGSSVASPGVITIQAGLGVNTAGSSFPFQAIATTPTILQNTPSAAPTVPAYVVFPICDDVVICAICSGETFMFTASVTFDFNPLLKGNLPSIVTSDAALLAALQGVTTFVYDVNTPASEWYVQIDTVHDAIQIKDGVTVSVAPFFGPSGKLNNNMLTPGIQFLTTCDFIVDQGGMVVVNSVNKQAGDIVVEAWGDIIVNGKILNAVSGTNGAPGAINLLNLCGDIRVGPTGCVEVVGQDPGGGKINIVSGEILSDCGCNLGVGGDIIIEGLVQAHSKAGSDAAMPTINIVAFDGKIVIDGNNLFGIEPSTKTPVTSGVHVFNRHNPHGGVINIQASQNVEVIGNTILNATNPNRGAISGNRKATNGQGNAGQLTIVSVYKDIVLTDRAIDFENRFNQKATVTLLAGQNINISALSGPQVVVNAQGGKSGTGGTICMHAGADINVGALASVLATAQNGTNGSVKLTADGVFDNDGVVSPITGPCDEVIDAVFESLADVLIC